MNDVPTLQEELDRKALETIEKMEVDLEQGRITVEQYAYGVDLIWLSWAGLVSKDLMPLIEIMGEKKGASATRAFFYRGDGRAVVITNDLKGKVLIESFSRGDLPDAQGIDRTNEPNPSVAGRRVYEQVIARFIERGFTQI